MKLQPDPFLPTDLPRLVRQLTTLWRQLVQWANGLKAADLPYDPTASGLTATDVQAAIDAVAASGGSSFFYRTDLTIPLAANFTAFGSGLTVADKSGRMQLAITTSGNLRGIAQASIAAPYTIDACLSLHGLADGTHSAQGGVFLGDGTQYRTFTLGQRSNSLQVEIFQWATAASASTVLAAAGLTVSFALFYQRITDDGTTRKFYISNNGKDYGLVYSEASNTGVTPTQCGLAIFADTASAELKASVQHWLITASVLGDAA